jgi:excisionase family DNA binding protein
MTGMAALSAVDRIDFPALLTAGDVAAILRVSPRTVRRWAENGQIDALRLAGHSVRFTAESVAAFMEPQNDVSLAGNEADGKAAQGDALTAT